MNTYYVEHTYPRASRQPVYGCHVQARTQSEALFLALGVAKRDGMKGTPLKTVARIDNSEAA